MFVPGTRSIMPRPFLVLFLLALTAVPTPSHAQRGAVTAARSLDQLTQEAEIIVHGYLTSARVEPHPQFKNLMTVVVSVSAQETLKGTPRKTLEFRQYIWDIRDQLDAARYRKGQEVVLLLGPVSKYGLTSPVGLEQGRFVVHRTAAGAAVAMNGRGNIGLFHATMSRVRARGIALPSSTATMVQRDQPGPVPLADLKDAIRAFVRAQ